MTGHFTSYENRTDHEPATFRAAAFLWRGTASAMIRACLA